MNLEGTKLKDFRHQGKRDICWIVTLYIHFVKLKFFIELNVRLDDIV